MSVSDAIASGYLAQVNYVVENDGTDWDEVDRLAGQRLSIRDLNRRLWLPARENAIARIVRGWVDRLSTAGAVPRTLVFCRSIEHTNRARVALNAVGVAAAELHSELTKFDTTRRLQAFRDGSVRVLTVVDMLNEGIDVPDVRLLVFNRVTHSRRIFLQQLGRGLRRTPDKDLLTVVDFVSDIRRLAALRELEAEYQAGPRRDLVIDIPPHLVRFTDESMERFVDALLRDIGDLQALGDDELVEFPENSPPVDG